MPQPHLGGGAEGEPRLNWSRETPHCPEGGAARKGSETLIGQGGALSLRKATPPATERLVARTPGKETLPFRSYGIPGKWRPALSPPRSPAARQGPGLRLAASGSRARAGHWVGAQVSGLSRTRRARVGMSRYLAVGGARGGTKGTPSVRRCSGLERCGNRSRAGKEQVHRPWRPQWAPGKPSQIFRGSGQEGRGPG